MFLLSGVESHSNELDMLHPRVFKSVIQTENFIASQFSSILEKGVTVDVVEGTDSTFIPETSDYDMGDSEVLETYVLPTAWKMGIQIGPYAIGRVVSEGYTHYYMEAPYHKIMYRVDRITTQGSVSIRSWTRSGDKGGMDPFWQYVDNEYINLTLNMAILSSLAIGREVPDTLPTTYEEIDIILPEDDPITKMIILYTMQKVHGKNAKFLYDSEYSLDYTDSEKLSSLALLLRMDEGTVAVDLEEQGVDPDESLLDGDICDAIQLYELSYLYRNLPSEIPTITTMFGNRITDIPMFQSALEKALLPGFNFQHHIEEAASFVSTSDIDVIGTLMKMVAKNKLIKGANIILNKYPCPAGIE